MNGYYDRPIVKPPAWRDFIPTYFFTGGLAGTAASLATAARISKRNQLADVMIYGAAAGTIVSTVCLIADLKRPERFYKMLRVFKPSSPMSVGVYLLSVFGAAATLAAASAATGIARPLGIVFEGIAGLLGPAMSVYTAVLIGDTAVPAWHYARKSMPFLFAATSASSAGAWGLLLAESRQRGPARALAIAGSLGALRALQMLHEELGPKQSEAYKKQQAGSLSNAAKIMTVAGAACAVLSKSSNTFAKLGGALLFGAGLAERFAVYRAGCASTKDPSYVIEAQGARASSHA